MAISELTGFLKYKDENGNINLLRPIITTDSIEGMDEIKTTLNETVKFTEQFLTEEEKAQARSNLGITGTGDGDGNGEDASKIIFPDGLKTTYAIGNVKLENGMGTLVKPGGSLIDLFNVFVNETNPKTVKPTVSLTISPQTTLYEVGEEFTPAYNASLNPGSYTYGPDTGVTVKEDGWLIKDSRGENAPAASGQKTSGTFSKVLITDDISYTITAEATYNDSDADPVTNIGNPYPAGKITSATVSKTSDPVTGYRKSFYGTLTEKGALNSNVIRGLDGKSERALQDGDSFTFTIPVGAMRVVIAYPGGLRKLTAVKDNAFGFPVDGGFEELALEVNGANDYDAVVYRVYVLDFGQANDSETTYTVTI